MISKAQLLSISNGGLRCKVKTFEGEILDNILILHPYGDASNPIIDKGSLVALFYPQGSKTSAFAVPYNPLLQPILEAGEKAVGNFAAGNKITFKKNGDIEISCSSALFSGLINAVGNINTSGVYKVNGVQVLKEQQPAIANPLAGLNQLHAVVDLILIAMRAHGFIAP
jgi:phage gp45-like